MAAFRIMPSINRIIGNVQNLRFSLPTIEKLYEECKLFTVDLENKNESFLDFQKEIKVDNISYSYPGVAIANLSNISFSIPVGKSIGFIGGSGAGKTTLIDIILGLLSPSQGSILVDGKDIALNMRAWQNIIGYIPQDIYLTDDTMRNNIAFGLHKDEINDLWVKDALVKAELKEFIDSLPDGLDTMVGEHGVRLSGGQRQRIGIARALYHKPNVLVMDESTSSLDNTTESKVMQSINTLHGEKTIIIIAHRLSTIKYCDYIYKLKNGKIIKEGDYKSIIQEED
jgi:ABC-type bacteriocin/lantibiotic exporter with double-glycine peptidase domain